MEVKAIAAAISVAAVMLAGLPVSPAAAADRVWHQSVGRVSATADCPKSSPDELAAGWSQWGPSWEQWMTGGKGGFVCSRKITWARDKPLYPSAYCEFMSARESVYVQFNGGYWLPFNYPVYTSSTCDDMGGGALLPLVYAPTGYDPTMLCESIGYPVALNLGTNVWACWYYVPV